MRLIDADALCNGMVGNDPVVIAAQCAPTIDPYKHGEWTWKQCVSVDDEYDLICSRCKSICDGYYDDENGEYLFKKSRFCPNCGACMKEDDHE